MLNKQTIYIAGPMRGYPEYNFEAFHAADLYLQSLGWDTINPAQVDINNGFDPKTPQYTLIGKDLEDFIIRDIHLVLSADAVAILPGWEKSKGVAVEIAIAKYTNIPIYVYPGMALLGHEDVLVEALRITSAGGDRQANYGPPDQDFARTAKMWSALKGVEFESREVAMFIIALKLSRETHQKKRDNAVDIAGYARCMDICRQMSEGKDIGQNNSSDIVG